MRLCGLWPCTVPSSSRNENAVGDHFAPNFIFVEQHAGPHPVSLRADDDLCVTQAGRVEQI